MSTYTYTNLYLSPKDWRRKNVQAILSSKFDCEFEMYTENYDDTDGCLCVVAEETYSYDELTALCDAKVSFFAFEDSTAESGGGHMLFVAHAGKSVYIQENGARMPVIVVNEQGKPDPQELALARQYWKLKTRVDAAILRKRDQSVCLDCHGPISRTEPTMVRNNGRLSHLECPKQ